MRFQSHCAIGFAVCALTASRALGADTFDRSVEAFAVAAGQYVDVVQAEAEGARITSRKEMILNSLYEYLVHPPGGAAGLLTDVPTIGSVENNQFGVFLCDPRADFARLQTSYTMLTNISSALGKLTDDTPNRIVPLIYALSRDYDSIMRSAAKPRLPTAAADDGSELEIQIAKKIVAPCRDDIQSYPDRIYGPFGSDERFFGAALGLIDVLKSTILPAVKSILGTIDQRRRNSAIREFINDDDNRALLTATIESLDDYMEQRFVNEAALSVAAASAAFAALQAELRPAGSLAGCADFIRLSQTVGSRIDEKALIRTEAFAECHAEYLRSLNGAFEDSLEAAAQYDLKADNRLAFSSAELNRALEYVHKVGQGKAPTPAEGEAFLFSIMNIIEIGAQIEFAGSKETRERISNAVDRVFGEPRKRRRQSEDSGAPASASADIAPLSLE